MITTPAPQTAAITGESYPEPINLADFLATSLPLQPPLIDGLLRLGEMGILAGESKSNKSWAVIQAGLCVASGLPFLERNTLQGRVLFVNTELQDATLHHRIGATKTALEKTGSVTSETFFVWNLRNSKIGVGFGEALNKAAKNAGAGLVILDPLYPLLGGRDENSNSDLAELLGGLRSYCETAGAAAIVNHHFAKGNSASKSAIDRASGAGAIARFADSFLTLSRHEAEDCFILEANLRSFAPVPPAGLRWDFPLLEVDGKLDAKKIRGRGGRRAEFTPGHIAEFVKPGMTLNAIAQAAEDAGVTSMATAKRLIKRGVVERLWEFEDGKCNPLPPSDPVTVSFKTPEAA